MENLGSRILLIVCFFLCIRCLGEEVIKLGITLDKTKGLSVVTRDFVKAYNYVFDHADHQDHVKIKLKILDDKYLPAQALENLKIFFRDMNIRILFGSVGTATLEGCLDYIRKNSILTLFPESGASVFHNKKSKNIINLWPMYFDVAYSLIKYAFKECSFDIKHIAIFYQNDSFGKELLSGAKKALNDISSKTKIVELAYQRNDLNSISKILKEINVNLCDTIVLFSTTRSAKEFIRVMKIENLRNKRVLGYNTLEANKIRERLKNEKVEILIVNEIPNYQTSELAIAQKFRNSGNQLPKNMYSFKAFLSAELFVDVLKKIGHPITYKKIKSELESLEGYDFGGIPLTFNNDKRCLSNFVWMDRGEETWEQVKLN